MTTKLKTAPWALLLMVALFAAAAQAEPVMIANNSVPADALSAAQVKDVFLGKSAQWDDGSRVVLGMIPGGAVSDAFLKGFVKKSPKQFSTFWKKAVFSGTGEMPQICDDEAAMVAWVAATPGAVGYVDSATPHDGVKVIAIN